MITVWKAFNQTMAESFFLRKSEEKTWQEKDGIFTQSEGNCRRKKYYDLRELLLFPICDPLFSRPRNQHCLRQYCMLLQWSRYFIYQKPQTELYRSDVLSDTACGQINQFRLDVPLWLIGKNAQFFRCLSAETQTGSACLETCTSFNQRNDL